MRTDGTVACWGLNSDGQSSPPGETFTQVSAGLLHTCGVRTDGTVACWGNDIAGQSTPPDGTFTQVSAGGVHNCGVRPDGTAVCWGGGGGDGRSSPPAEPFTQVSAGNAHSCGVLTNGSVVCWGSDNDGQSSPPAGLFTQVSAGLFHTCAVRTDGTVACWGSNDDGRSSPPAGTFAQVSAGGLHTCALRTDGRVACWGSNHFAQSSPSMTSTEPPGSEVGQPYSHQFTTTHQRPGPVFEVTAGSLPPGLMLSGAGLLAGEVSEDGSFSATVCGTNGLAEPACQSFTIDTKATPEISTFASPGGMVGTPVRDVATLSGGSSPTGTVTFRLFSDDACSVEVFSSTNDLDGLTATSGWFSPAAAGTYHWTALYNGDDANNPVLSPCLAPDESVTITPFAPPAFTQTITGDHLGPVTVAAGQSLYIGPGARVVGPVTVAPGGALTVEGARISRGITADDPAFLSVCGSDVTGPPPSPGLALAVSDAAVPVRVGDPAAGCARNRFAGHVSFTSVLAATFGANVVSHNATFTGGGPGATVIGANTVFGTLACTGHDPVPTDAGQPNTAAAKTGQCAGL